MITTEKSMSTAQAAKSVKRKSTVFLVDDHPVVRHGLALVIGQQGDLEVCGEAANASDAIKMVEQNPPDLMIIDISLEDGDGIELIKDIRIRQPKVKMLVSSMHDEELYAERALRAGARGYIGKAAPSEQFINAIRQILKGELYVSEAMSSRLLQRAVGGKTELARSPVESLSDRELTVFGMIGQGMSTRQIAKKLFLSIKTVETYREHIKTKLNLASGTELTHHAMRWQFKNG